MSRAADDKGVPLARVAGASRNDTDLMIPENSQQVPVRPRRPHFGVGNAPTVSLIVTTYNWTAALDLVLSSVAHQSQLPDEVIIADDGSAADTAHCVGRWGPRLGVPLKHVWQEDNGYRLARSRNRAIAAATADYIVLVDGDMILHPQFIADHVARSRRGCFIQGARPRLSESDTERLLRACSIDINPWRMPMEHRAYAIRSVVLSRLTSRIRPTLGGIQGCNQSYWRSDLVEVNGFDERFEGWGPEDRELAARLLNIGVRRHYVRHMAIAYHLHHTTRAPDADNPYDEILTETLRTGRKRCDKGLSLHTV